MKSPALIVGAAALALIFSGSGAVAASLITSAQIKDGAIKNVDVAEHTLTVDRLTTSAQSSLRGARGFVGPAGPKGSLGPTGQMGPQGAPGRDGGPDRVASWRVTYPGGNVPYVLHLSSQSIPKGTEIEFTSLKVSGDYSSFCVGGRSTVSVGGPFIVNGASWNPKFTTLSPNLGSPQVVPEPVQLNLNVSCNDVDNRRIDVPAYTIDVSFALTDMSMPATETFD